MLTLFAALIFTLLAPFTTAQADSPPSTGKTPDANGVAYRIDAGDTLMVDRHGVCKMVTNNDPTKAIFVPTKTSGEWASFRTNAPNISLAECAVDCTLDGTTVADGDSITAYKGTRPCGDACGDIDQVRTCTYGTLDGDSSYSDASCPAMEACLNCSSDDGVTIAHNTSDVLYTTESATCGSSCTGQTRSCWDGSLDGDPTYRFANCTIETCPFIVEMDPTAGGDGTTSTQVKIPTWSGTYNYDIRWTQGSNSGEVTNLTGSYTLNLPGSGLVDIEIRGVFPHWKSQTGIQHGITDVKRWGAISWASMHRMFDSESLITSFSAPDTPDLTNVTDMSWMFYQASQFNSDISTWDVSNVANMERLFRDAEAFNQPLNSWDVSSVTNMKDMFGSGTTSTSAFNQPLNSWNTSLVEDMSFMFSRSDSFNQNIGSWDTSNVTSMRAMFQFAPFDQYIGSWDVSNLDDASGMFWGSDFNQDIGSWDVSNVSDMGNMFRDATTFDQDISGWCVPQFPSKPSGFDYGTPAGWTTSEKPNWGSCGAASGCESFIQYMRCTGSVLSSSSQAGAFACTGYCEGVSGASCCEYSSSFTCEATDGFADVGGSSSQSAANCN